MKRVRLLGVALLLLTLSAVTLLAAPAGKPAARAKSVAAANDSDAVLARVGKEVITRRTLSDRLMEIPDQYRANYQTPDGRKQLLDRLIEERVWLQDAEANGVAARPDIQRQIVTARRDLLVRTWVNEALAANPAPSDSEAKVYYDAHHEDFRSPASVNLSHIMVKTEAEAKKVLALAKVKDADWKLLVTKFSTDSLTRGNAGNLGSVGKEGMFVALGAQPALAESAMALGEGRIGGPYHTAKGWHVIKVDSDKPEATRTFDQVRTFIVRTLTQQKQGSFYQEVLGKARARIGVTPDSTAIKNYLSAKKSARELFQDAQQAGAPQAKIDGYHAVVATYPDADIAPQAQFMSGFVYSEELQKYDDAEKEFRALLAKYPKSELAASAQWMIDNMRTKEAPSFPGADSIAVGMPAGKGSK